MNLVVNPKSEKPIYLQLYEDVTAEIARGNLKADEMLPSIRTVAREMRVSIITVKTAWEMLERDGYLYTRAGVGCFVKENTRQKVLALAEERLLKDLEFYKKSGLTKEELIAIIERNY